MSAGPIVVNQKVFSDLAVGDYVFASRWSDCDWGDPWYVGHVAEIDLAVGRVRLAESPRSWRNAMKITHEQGRRIVERYPELERQFIPLDYGLVAEVFGVDVKGAVAMSNLEPLPPNDDGRTMCAVRWMVETEKDGSAHGAVRPLTPTATPSSKSARRLARLRILMLSLSQTQNTAWRSSIQPMLSVRSR